MHFRKAKKKASDDALFKLAVGLNSSLPKPDEKPVDLIKEQIEKNNLLIGKGPQKVVADGAKTDPNKDFKLPDATEFIQPIVLEGHKFRRTNIPALDAMTVLMYIVCEVLADDPRVQSILADADFRFADQDGTPIFPKKVKTENKKAKSRNDRPTK